MDIQDFTDWLLKHKNPSSVINLVDAYIQTIHKVGDSFVLPKQHEELKPAIEKFVYDQTAFVEYVKSVRDSLDGVMREEVHGLYRTLLTRNMQQLRRIRMNRALAVYEDSLGNRLSYQDRLRYFKHIEQAWAKDRLKYMSMHRTGKKRLSTDERYDVLQEYWKEIDERITKGELPDGFNATVES